MMVVLINAYTGVLTSYMTVPKLKPIPQSLEQLASMKEYKVSVIKDSVLANSFLVRFIFFPPVLITIVIFEIGKKIEYFRMPLQVLTKFWVTLCAKIQNCITQNGRKQLKMF